MIFKKYKGFFALLITAIILSFFGVFIKELDKYYTGNFQVALRSFVAIIIALFIVVIRRYKFVIERSKLIPFLVFLTAFPISLILFTASATTTKATNSIFMLYVGSLAISYIVGTFLFKESNSKQKIIAFGLAIVGLIVYTFPFNFSQDGVLFGIIFGVLAGVFEGITHASRKLLKNIPREVLLVYQYGFTSILAFVLTFGTSPVKDTSFTGIVIVLLFGFCLLAIGYLLLYGFQHFDVNIGTIILASELLFATIVNFIFLTEIPTITELLGGLIIFSASILASVNLNEIRKKLQVNK